MPQQGLGSVFVCVFCGASSNAAPLACLTSSQFAHSHHDGPLFQKTTTPKVVRMFRGFPGALSLAPETVAARLAGLKVSRNFGPA